MPTTQANRPLIVTTPLGPDALLAVAVSGREAVSQLFHFNIDCLAERATKVPFEKLLGEKVSLKLELPGKKERFFSGICSRVSQGESDDEFNRFRLEVVPQFWLLTKRAQSRIFQHITVPDILKQVLSGLDVTFELQGKYEPRDFCVQYRETDFNFASRTMEEEGIFYFFKHANGSHKMIVADTPQSHPDLAPSSKLPFKMPSEGAAVEGEAVFDLGKSQEVTSGKFTLWDHTFELPHKHLEADKLITETVQAGKVAHKLKTSENGKLEVYDWPGEYAQRFDGVDRGGGDRPAELQKIFTDNKRTVELRMQAAAAGAVSLKGASNCRHLCSGFKVTIDSIDATSQQLGADGPYILTSVQHTARLGADFRSGDGPAFDYSNTFTLQPAGVPFRPQRTTLKPTVAGTQTAVVVGPKGEEIFTDRYGRVKCQFHWDRDGKNDADSSCWVRVAQFWAGKRWGASFWPRIGQEVIVDFLEGDPDQPVIIGSLYNADQMPPYLGGGPDKKHPNDNKLCGVKSSTTPGGDGFNEWRFDDTKNKEQVFIHAERNYDQRVKASSMTSIGGSAHLTVGGEKDGKKTGDIKQRVFNDLHLHVGNDEIRFIEHDRHDTVKNNVISEVLEGGSYTAVPKSDTVHQGKAFYLTSDTNLVMDASDIFITGKKSIQLNVGGNFIKIDPSGVTIFGTLVRINCPGSVASPVPPTPPVPPPAGGKPTAGANTLKPDDPTPADTAVTGIKSAP
jgi:type VI secretion system secreted protein VgrG